jgi:hypothetical protein
MGSRYLRVRVLDGEVTIAEIVCIDDEYIGLAAALGNDLRGIAEKETYDY